MPQKAVPGILALMGIALVGMIIQKLVPLNIPSIAYIGILGLILTIPGVPGSAQLVHWTHNVELMALCTPVVAYAGISIGNSWADFCETWLENSGSWSSCIDGYLCRFSCSRSNRFETARNYLEIIRARDKIGLAPIFEVAVAI